MDPTLESTCYKQRWANMSCIDNKENTCMFTTVLAEQSTIHAWNTWKHTCTAGFIIRFGSSTDTNDLGQHSLIGFCHEKPTRMTRRVAMVITDLINQTSTCQPVTITDAVTLTVDIKSIHQWQSITVSLSVFHLHMTLVTYPSNQWPNVK